MEIEAEKQANERAVGLHRATWGEPAFAIRAPGRVNLIGEHTDYNDGFCLPMALDFDTVVAVSPDADPKIVQIHSEDFGTVTIDTTKPGHEIADWATYVAGVLWLLAQDGIPAGGWRGVITSDIPSGAGLSSSAALEVAIAKVVLNLAEAEWSALQIAKLGQRVESEIVGLPSGIMDQFISAGAIAGHAGLLDCQELSLTPIALPPGLTVAVMDTGTRRRLAETAYGKRRASCEAAAKRLGLASLREATLEMVDQLPDSMALGRQRARHVVTENSRTLRAVEAIGEGDTSLLGSLMDESHRSLRNDYEVSSPALDRMVEVARQAPGCRGARMTGGGFAGCAVAILDSVDQDVFRDRVLAEYDFVDPVTSESFHSTIWFCTPQAGAGPDSILDR